MAAETENPACDCCGGTHTEPHSEAQRATHVCLVCGSVFPTPEPAAPAAEPAAAATDGLPWHQDLIHPHIVCDATGRRVANCERMYGRNPEAAAALAARIVAAVNATGATACRGPSGDAGGG